MTRDELEAVIWRNWPVAAAEDITAVGAILAAVDAYTHAHECWCCGNVRPVHTRTADGPLCSSCYKRWQRNGFSGAGPGPSQKPPVADSAREHAAVITSMSARLAAEKLDVSPRTVQRWRAALAVAS